MQVLQQVNVIPYDVVKEMLKHFKILLTLTNAHLVLMEHTLKNSTVKHIYCESSLE